MSNELLEINTIKHEVLSQDFFLALKDQINRDFERAGLTMNIENANDFDSLNNLFYEGFKKLNDSQDLKQLYYTIDLSEKWVAHANLDLDPVSSLTSLIIRREAFKVFLRRNYQP